MRLTCGRKRAAVESLSQRWHVNQDAKAIRHGKLVTAAKPRHDAEPIPNAIP